MFTYVKISLQRYKEDYLESRIIIVSTKSEPSNDHLINQGGLPEVEEFIAKYMK